MNRLSRLNGLLLSLLLLSVLACACSQGREASVKVIQLPRVSDVVHQPKVSGERVVWSGFDLGGREDFEVYTWTPGDGTVQVTDDEVDDMAPQVDGDRIVWQRNMVPWDKSGDPELDDFDWEIFTWTPEDGIVRITENDWWDRGPQVSDGRVAWQGTGGSDGGSDLEVFTWTAHEGIRQLTENGLDDGGVGVSGNRVVWTSTMDDNGTARDGKICMWTPAEGVVQLTDDSGNAGGAAVSGDRVVWLADGASVEDDGREILTWTPAEGMVRILQGDRTLDFPGVSGDLIVWRGAYGSDGGSDLEVFGWTPIGGVLQLTDNDYDDEGPLVSGGRVVWQRVVGVSEIDAEAFLAGYPDWVKGDGRMQIFTWAPGPGPSGTTTQIAEVAIPDSCAVSGDWVVWSGVPLGGRLAEVFLGEIQSP